MLFIVGKSIRPRVRKAPRKYSNTIIVFIGSYSALSSRVYYANFSLLKLQAACLAVFRSSRLPVS